MKVLACLVIALWATGSGAAELPNEIQFGTYVLYDATLRNRSTTGIGVYTKLLINSINARLRMNVNETQIQLVLVGMKEVENNTIIPDPDALRDVSYAAESLQIYLDKETDDAIKNADIVLYISGAILKGMNFRGEYYKAWSSSGSICSSNKGVVAGLYTPDFDKMESIMFGILKLLGSGVTGGIAANLKKATKSKSCFEKNPVGVHSSVTRLPGEGLNETAYCKEFASDNDLFSFCGTLNDGCTLSCCWNNTKESRITSAPDGFGCGKENNKICFMDKCVERSSLEVERSNKKPKK
ncbi:uncharacterized protein LOC135370266 isoform X2 [Ornithodoros turicata]|uniref:uncharacterized protein LOC135370266 isoform X2 n=1 Tax=Ornithodoros turicata TaxID=34597 RepID=UPI00313983D7